MSERKAVTKTTALRYARSDLAAKKTILDELCALTLWHWEPSGADSGYFFRPS
ncbi:hypothetical protein NG697_16020 [Pseudarthrobacter sp. MDT3-26]|uniref:hypothetical protein n=1 Tax=Pseudarthrobacter raffinosi TaxID=2953651 RepID=UPI00208F480A|nr:hypothetical protein [Pseudarthrobacter sp. MDT3-26]MCO4264408.1 hypothetical protein [Pseudarthrobacter sp. MDT3-26]